MNLPPTIGTVVSRWGSSALVDLGTTLGVEDLYDLLEVLSIDAYNQRVMTPQD